MEIFFSWLIALAFFVLMFRKVILVYLGKTAHDQIVRSVLSQAKAELGITNCHHSLDYALVTRDRPIHVVDEKYKVPLRGFKAEDANLQKIGDTMYFLCYFDQKIHDDDPDKIISTSGQFEQFMSFIKLLTPREIKDLKKLKTNFKDSYLVGIMRNPDKSLSASIYISKRTIEPPIKEITRRQNNRSLISKLID